MWLDGLYRVKPFYLKFRVVLRDNYNDYCQSIRLDGKSRSRRENGFALSRLGRIKGAKWANKKRVKSARLGTSDGLVCEALVDVLDSFPKKSSAPRRTRRHFAARSRRDEKYQDKTGFGGTLLICPERKKIITILPPPCLFTRSPRCLSGKFVPEISDGCRESWAGIKKNLSKNCPTESQLGGDCCQCRDSAEILT